MSALRERAREGMAFRDSSPVVARSRSVAHLPVDQPSNGRRSTS